MAGTKTVNQANTLSFSQRSNSTRVAYFHHLKKLVILFFLVIFFSKVAAQDEPYSYSFSFAPDLWYNDVDGIRVGIRTLGEVEGTFKDGPHRLDAGIWVGTWLPDSPVSYFVSFTEPIKAISDFGNEGSVQLISSIRAGYSQHKFQFNKRWQPGFDEYEYKEIAISFSQEKMFDSEYRPYKILWQDNSKSLFGADFRWSAAPEIGRFLARISVKQNINIETENFTVGTLELSQRIDLNDRFKVRLRFFGGLGSEKTAPEHLFLSSMESPQNWIDKGVSRSKGTIPQPWLEAGSFQVGGGPNLRGYLNRDIDLLNLVNKDGSQILFPIYKSMIAFNTEIEFPNPFNTAIKNISVIGDLIEFRTYLFADIGKGNDYTIIRDPDSDSFPDIVPPLVSGVPDEPGVLADAGTGLQLSVNIPDYLGKDRGIFIRYDIPFWLSDPSGSEANFSFRQLIGVGATISF